MRKALLTLIIVVLFLAVFTPVAAVSRRPSLNRTPMKFNARAEQAQLKLLTPMPIHVWLPSSQGHSHSFLTTIGNVTF